MPDDIVYQSYSIEPGSRLSKGDITILFDDYKLDHGKYPELIIINPCHQKLLPEIPPGIFVDFENFIMSWEIWTADDVKMAYGEVVQNIDQTQSNQQELGDGGTTGIKPLTDLCNKGKRGRPPKAGPVHRTTLWRREKAKQLALNI